MVCRKCKEYGALMRQVYCVEFREQWILKCHSLYRCKCGYSTRRISVAQNLIAKENLAGLTKMEIRHRLMSEIYPRSMIEPQKRVKVALGGHHA